MAFATNMQTSILNIVIGATSLKVISSQKQDTDIVINSSAMLTSGSKLFLNENSLNIDLIEDRLRIFMLENNIKRAKACFSLPDYLITTTIVPKERVIDNNYLNSMVKNKNFSEILEDGIEDEYSQSMDCQIINSGTYADGEGFTDIAVTYLNSEIVKNLKRMCKRLKLVPLVLESECSSLIRLIDMFDIKDSYMILDVGDIHAKLIVLTGTSGLKIRTIPSGIYKIDNILAAFRGSNITLTRQQRITAGMIAFNDSEYNMLQEYIQKNFSDVINEELHTIYQNAHGFHYIKNFFVTGGAWSYFEFKETVQDQTINTFSEEQRTFETLESKLDDVIFGNPIVERDLRDNICLFASCVGLALRGGM